MSKPSRHANPKNIARTTRTFFVTTKTAMGKRLFQSDRNALLFVDVLRAIARKLQIHDFVIMPDHIHILLSVDNALTIEQAMQLIKGGYSYRLRKEHGYTHDVWQRGFADDRVHDFETFRHYREYIAQNPVRAGLVRSSEEYPFSFNFLARKKAAGAKAPLFKASNGTTEVVPFHRAKKEQNSPEALGFTGSTE